MTLAAIPENLMRHARLLLIKDKHRMLPLLGIAFLASLHEVLCLHVQHQLSGQLPEGSVFTYGVTGVASLLLLGYIFLLHMTPKQPVLRVLSYTFFPVGVLLLSVTMIVGHNDTLIWFALPVLTMMTHLFHLKEQAKWPGMLGMGILLIFAAVVMPVGEHHINPALLQNSLLCNLSNASLMSLAFWFLLATLKRYDDCILELNTALSTERSSANRDALTGLLNRRSFTSELHREIARHQRTNAALSFAIFDIDHFKQINDVYGHQAGDEVLTEISTLIRHNLRSTDVFARYGGEEFALLLPSTNCLDALTMLDRLRFLVEEHLFIANRHNLRVTISIGVTQFDVARHTLEGLIHEADTAMYEAKNSGRNQVRATGLGKLSQEIVEQRRHKRTSLLPEWLEHKLSLKAMKSAAPLKALEEPTYETGASCPLEEPGKQGSANAVTSLSPKQNGHSTKPSPSRPA